MCGAGLVQVLPCSGERDRVCASCPNGFGCDDDKMRICIPGTYSVEGRCVSCGENRTTLLSGAVSEDDCVCLLRDDTGRCSGGCEMGQVVVGGSCRDCPLGFGCDRVSGQPTQCKSGTYSSPLGDCVACVPNAHSVAGAGSADECLCDMGFVKTDSQQCVACQPGTYYSQQQCISCDAGQYCLGRLHHEPCPGDMFSPQGSAVCTACRMNSGCLKRCTDHSNCTCDNGFVDHGGECRRCPAATMKKDDEGCIPCPRGMECLGGAEVHSCGLSTYSSGNSSRCARCRQCEEITVARCNATHDSVCEPTSYALAVVTLTQYYHTVVDGETFAMFAMVLASSLPKAQLVQVCGSGSCVHCFQGQCPRMQRIMPRNGNEYEITIEIRSDATRLAENVESLTQSAFLPELAKTVMSKLTDIPFALRSRVEHNVICPDRAEWNGGECVPPLTTSRARTWLGLGVASVLLTVLAVYGRNRAAGEISWERVERVTE